MFKEESIVKSKLEANPTEATSEAKSILQSTKMTESSTRFFDKDQLMRSISPPKMQLQTSQFFFNKNPPSKAFDFVSQKELKGFVDGIRFNF